MTKREKFTVGKFTFCYQQFDVLKDFSEDDLQGRTLEKDFVAQLLAAGVVIQPIIMTLFEEKMYLMDGRKRILHSRYIAELAPSEITAFIGPDSGVSPADFRYITAKVFFDISPLDQSIWTLILNEERSDNLILAWAKVRELQALGKWDEIAREYKLNKQRFAKFAQLDKLERPEVWVQAYQTGKVAEDTILAVSKLGGRQNFAVEALEKKGKLTGKDVIGIKSVSVRAAINNRPFDMNVPANGKIKNIQLYVVYDPVNKIVECVGELTEALARKRELSGTFELYQMTRV